MSYVGERAEGQIPRDSSIQEVSSDPQNNFQDSILVLILERIALPAKRKRRPPRARVLARYDTERNQNAYANEYSRS
jgi:hypothetical protein